MQSLTRQDLPTRVSLPSEQVHVPLLGGYLRVQGMTLKQRAAFESSLQKPRSRSQRRAGDIEIDVSELRQRLVAWCVVDDEGQRLFTDADIPALGDYPSAALEPIVEAAQRLSGIGENDIEEIAGEIKQDPFAGSSSTSQSG